MQEPVVPRKDARIPRTPSTNQIPAGRVQGRRGVLKNGSLDQSGLEGAGALRARSLARRETGHGARGRTRRARSPVRLTHAASPRPEAPPQPRSDLAVSRQSRAVCKHTRASRKVVSPIPPSARRPWRRSAPGPSPRSRRKDKKAMGPPWPAGISFSHNRGRGNPRGQVKDKSSCEDREVAAGRLVARSGEAKLEVSALWVLPGCPGGWRDGSRARGIRYSEESPGGS